MPRELPTHFSPSCSDTGQNLGYPVVTPSQWKESFPNICGLPLLLFFWLKWAGYLAVAGLNLLAQISDRISPYGV